MFDMVSPVFSLSTNGDSELIFRGTFEDVCAFMAQTYATKEFEKVILAGPYAESVGDRVRSYYRTNYNLDDINIEIME